MHFSRASTAVEYLIDRGTVRYPGEIFFLFSDETVFFYVRG